MKKVLLAVVIAFVALPVAAVATFLLIPFWSWLEARTGIESIGHSGPSEWCFVLIYAFTLAAALGMWLWLPSRTKR